MRRAILIDKSEQMISKDSKDLEGSGIKVQSSGNVIQTLLKHDLADELRRKTFPITLAMGKRLFGEGTRPAAFMLSRAGEVGRKVIAGSSRLLS